MRRASLVLLAALLLGGAHEADPRSREYGIKAAFLYNFLKYVEWPEQRLPQPQSPLAIGAYCPKAFAETLERVVAGRRVGARAVQVRTLTAPADAGSVHLVFVCAEQEAMWGAVAPLLDGVAVVTVADSGSRRSRDAVIAFELDGDKLRFSISAYHAARARVRISDQLQKLAVFVRREP